MVTSGYGPIRKRLLSLLLLLFCFLFFFLAIFGLICCCLAVRAGRRVEGDHREGARDGGGLRPLLRHGPRQRRRGAHLLAALRRSQPVGARAAVGARRLAAQRPQIKKNKLIKENPFRPKPLPPPFLSPLIDKTQHNSEANEKKNPK